GPFLRVTGVLARMEHTKHVNRHGSNLVPTASAHSVASKRRLDHRPGRSLAQHLRFLVASAVSSPRDDRSARKRCWYGVKRRHSEISRCCKIGASAVARPSSTACCGESAETKTKAATR